MPLRRTHSTLYLATLLTLGCSARSAPGTGPRPDGGTAGRLDSGVVVATGGTTAPPARDGSVEPKGPATGDGAVPRVTDADVVTDAAPASDAALQFGPTRPDGYRLVWNDEFDGTTIDQTKWTHEVNCWGGGNGEDQCYVADKSNSFVQGGSLHIVARNDRPSGAIGGPDNNPTMTTKGHSSARLRTRNQGDWRYGRIEVRAMLPFGQGLWPAIWMLPTDEVYGGWAQSGEIDIMEAVNLKVAGETHNRIYGTLHYGGGWPENVHSGHPYDPPTDVTSNMHLYAVEWERGEIRWFVDDNLYATQTSWHSNGNDFPAPFDRRFHLLLNVAVGGAWPGPPNAATLFPQRMTVDYVRVYTCEADPQNGHGCGTRDANPAP